MAYNKTSEERKWNYWKEQEEKKLRELGIYELLKETEHQTLEILLLSTWGYSGREVAKIMGMAEQTIYTKRNRLRKKLKNFIINYICLFDYLFISS